MDAVAMAKRSRGIGKSRFTRALNVLKTSLENNDDIALVEGLFDNVRRAWENVQQLHDQFLITQEELGDEDQWIDEPEKQYVLVTKMVYDYKVKLDKVNKANVIHNELCQAQKTKDFEYDNYKIILSNLDEIINDDFKGKNVALTQACGSLDSAYAKCVTAEESLSRLGEKGTDSAWLKALNSEYLEVKQRVAMVNYHLSMEEKGNDSNIGIKLRPMELPTFSGNIRQYARFKSDFKKHIQRYCHTDDDIVFTLRSCLKGTAATIIQTADDDLNEIWGRLDDEYGDPGRLIDMILGDINGFKIGNDVSGKRFIEVVNIVERGYHELKLLSLEKEISNSTTVGIIEGKLPEKIRERWAHNVSKRDSSVNKYDKFPSLVEFLLEEKRAVRYLSVDVRSKHEPAYTSTSERARVNYVSQPNQRQDSSESRTPRCWLHNTGNHSIVNCNVFLEKNAKDRISLVRQNGACWSCLGIGHKASSCRRKKVCGVRGCNMYHHAAVHDTESRTEMAPHAVSNHAVGSETSSRCLLQIMQLRAATQPARDLNVLWDSGATVSFITFEAARKCNLQGKPEQLSVVKVGGKTEHMSSFKYVLPVRDRSGGKYELIVYGIEQISSEIQQVDMGRIKSIFRGRREIPMHRPSGSVDVLIGYNYAGLHPVVTDSCGNLLILENNFGACIGGSHPEINESTRSVHNYAVDVHHVTSVSVRDFLELEDLGVSCNPKCGECRCGKCSLGSDNCTLKESHELSLIEGGLHLEDGSWHAKYPWVRDPQQLPDNKRVVLATLKSTEKRLLRSPEMASIYQAQIRDMVERGVARKLSKEEIDSYKGPKYYITHHEVLKEEKSSTPCRIVFNSSAKYMGYAVNDYWGKGPDMLNNLLGIVLRFREGRFVIIGDIKKMYHSIRIDDPLDQHTHRFLWRDLDTEKEPDTYVMTRVSFGDKPAGTIATVALQKTASMERNTFPLGAETLMTNTYMDDVISSFATKQLALDAIQEVENILHGKGFQMKEWTANVPVTGQRCTNENPNVDHSIGYENERKILGVKWSPEDDSFRFNVNLNFSLKVRNIRSGASLTREEVLSGIPSTLTRRIVLSQVSGIYGPMGLIAPFVVRAKFLMRRLWTDECKEMGWDDAIPHKQREEWVGFFEELFDVESLRFERCVTPNEAAGNPTLVVFSDASAVAYGACAFIRWKLCNGRYSSRLLMAKSRVAPVKQLTIVRLELCAAVMAARLRRFIVTEMRMDFDDVYFVVDSNIVRCMIQKESHGFNTFVAVRIGEIQTLSEPNEWFWLEGRLNIADWITRGKTPIDLCSDSIWQRGPDFLYLPREQWPITQGTVTNVPERKQVVMAVSEVKMGDTLVSRININRFSSYGNLLRVTSRVLAMYRCSPVPSFRNVSLPVTRQNLDDAKLFWIRDAQSSMPEYMAAGKYIRLCPSVNKDGIVVVGSRVSRLSEVSFDRTELPLLPYDHPYSRLYAEFVHNRDHAGVATTVSKIRRVYWIVDIHRLVKKIRHRCVTCRREMKRLEKQIMADLPIERLVPAPAWSYTCLDLFGPFAIRGEVNKRSRGKVYGVIFTCLQSRAVHLDLSNDYSTQGFLFVLRRFMSLRGSPLKLYSDRGTQLIGASAYLKDVMSTWDWDSIGTFSDGREMEWNFSPGDAPWYNGCAESLIRAVKKALHRTLGEQIVLFSELQTLLTEAANLINERPIGRHPTDPDDGAYLCPNDLLLGRASAHIPSGPWKTGANLGKRYELVQNLIDVFWRKWTRDYFYSLLIRPKWHVKTRNLRKGDVVLMQDSNALRGRWKLALVSEVFPDQHGVVRKVELNYKNMSDREAVGRYAGSNYVKVMRPVQRLVLLCPVDDTS